MKVSNILEVAHLAVRLTEKQPTELKKQHKSIWENNGCN